MFHRCLTHDEPGDLMELDIDIEEWPAEDWEGLAKRAMEACAAAVPELADPRLSVSLLFTSDAEVHALNRDWRKRDKPTNVLSFPMLSRAELLVLGPDRTAEMPPVALGDLALAYGTCAREAAEKGVPLDHHAAHLIVHGLLHLAGYDHETGDKDADKMEELEIAILAKMGIADPYGDRET